MCFIDKFIVFKIVIDIVGKTKVKISSMSSEEIYLGIPPRKYENYIRRCNRDGYDFKENIDEDAIDEESVKSNIIKLKVIQKKNQ